MTARHILSRYERCCEALPRVRSVGKLSFWLSCLYVAEEPRTIRDLAAVSGLTYNQAKVHLALMKSNQLVTVTTCRNRTRPGSLLLHTASDRMTLLLGLHSTSTPTPAS